ncbi:PAS domain S-box protein [Halovenus rubra]|uniref:PAS domain S-box protein n=2 Tax=Halovenus rubra TaxID=869890 RepID=A0ACC7E4J4_9EURY|nr:PAS domain S-box protein [Halovenus rubra]
MNQSIKILYVDDESEFADLSSTFLEHESQQFTIETATSAQEGLTLLSDEIECIISDYEIPGKDGLTFLNEVRDTYSDLPFILFTRKGSEEVASEAISAGVTDYLRKQNGSEQYELLAKRVETAVDQYRAERKVDRHDYLFSKAHELADVGVWEWDRQTEDGYYSDQVYEIYGADPSRECTPKEDITEFYHPDDRERMRTAFRDAIEAGEHYDIEARIIAADGTRKWIRTLGDPVFEDGSCQRVRGTIREITERKERERELEQQRKRLTVALEGSNAGVWEWDPETDDVVWHESTERLFGLEVGTFEGTYEAFAERVHPEDIGILEGEIEAALPTHDPFEAEYRIQSVDNGDIWIYARAEFVDIEGLSPRYVGVISDITERKQREHELERAKERYRTLLDAAPDAIFVADAESGEIQQTNQAASELLDRPREEIIGMHQTDLHPPERAEEYAEIFRDHVTSGVGRAERLGEGTDIYVKDANGAEIPVEISARTVEIEGTHFIQGYFRDITDRKEREKELQRQNERLDEFVSVVSHDLRNPLSVLSLWLDMIETEDQDEIERCRRAVTRMDQLIDDLLALAHHGETDSDSEPVSLSELPSECWEITPTGEAELRVETDASVIAKRTRLKQLFENLFTNAVTHGGEDVTITVGHIDDGFYVEDDGVGIPEDEREQSLEAGYSTGDSGTGLGLNIVKQIVLAEDWEIHVIESDEGGARFEITGVDILE